MILRVTKDFPGGMGQESRKKRLKGSFALEGGGLKEFDQELRARAEDLVRDGDRGDLAAQSRGGRGEEAALRGLDQFRAAEGEIALRGKGCFDFRRIEGNWDAFQREADPFGKCRDAGVGQSEARGREGLDQGGAKLRLFDVGDAVGDGGRAAGDAVYL